MSQTHLLRRNAVFYYHRRVPLPLIDKFGKKVILISLGTKDLKEAKRLRNLHDLQWDTQFEAANLGSNAEPQFAELSSGAALNQVVRDFVRKSDRRAESTLLADPPDTMDQKSEMANDLDYGLGILKNCDDPRGSQWVQAQSSKIVSVAVGVHGTNSSDIFAEIVRRGLLELQNRKLARLDDDFSRSFFNPEFGPEAEPPKVRFSEVADQFLALTDEQAKANATSQKWVEKQRANAAALKEIVGDGTGISDVHYDACIRVRTALAGLPANKGKFYPGLSVEEAIKRAKLDGKPLLSPVTQDQYLATFRAILDLAAKKRLIGINPASDLKPLKKDTVSAGDKRLPFTNLQLNQLFRGGYYRTCAQMAEPAYSFDKTGWRFWMPLIALFMGMRPNEICQLSAHDVKATDTGTWFINVVASDDINEGGGDRKQLKTATSRRRIPLHPEIIAMGFIEFAVRRQKVSKKAKLFPELQPDEYGNHAKYALKRFRETFLPEALKLDKRQSFYSLRHNFRDALRRANAPPDALQSLGGWSQGSLVSDRYGDRDNPDYQLRFIEAVSYPGLDLSFLHAKSPLSSSQ